MDALAACPMPHQCLFFGSAAFSHHLSSDPRLGMPSVFREPWSAWTRCATPPYSGATPCRCLEGARKGFFTRMRMLGSSSCRLGGVGGWVVKRDTPSQRNGSALFSDGRLARGGGLTGRAVLRPVTASFDGVDVEVVRACVDVLDGVDGRVVSARAGGSVTFFVDVDGIVIFREDVCDLSPFFFESGTADFSVSGTFKVDVETVPVTLEVGVALVVEED